MSNNNFDMCCALGYIISFFGRRGVDLSPINVEAGKREYCFDAEKVHKLANPVPITQRDIEIITNKIRGKSGGNITFELDEENGKYILMKNA